MDFRLPLQPTAWEQPLTYQDKFFLLGSCFTENMYEKLVQHKFQCLQNPHGILFNPASIQSAISDYVHANSYTADDLFCLHEAWHSWAHHSRFSHPNPETALHLVNESIAQARQYLKTATVLVVTLGSAWVYKHLEKDQWVANCHKAPAQTFKREFLSISVLNELMRKAISELRAFNPQLRIVFTISPVRHLREGFVENNRSKARLMETVHQMVEDYPFVQYFPAYEYVIDDLRDYRFYAEDMVHPNYLATQYVWEKLVATCISPTEYAYMKEIKKLQIALRHRPFNPNSLAHAQFLASHLVKTQEMQKVLPFLNWEEELRAFTPNKSGLE